LARPRAKDDRRDTRHWPYFLKYERASEHLKAIIDEAGPFIETGLYATSGTELTEEDDWVILRWGTINTTPVRWGLYVGDFVQNARACLDHLVRDLVVANGAEPGNHTQFPIYDSKTNWTQDIEERDPKRKAAPTAGLTEEVLAIIELHQPLRHTKHQERQNDPLMHLLRMSNADKHRTLHSAALHTGQLQNLEFLPAGYVQIQKVKTPPTGGRIELGAEIARVKLKELKPADQEVGVRFMTPAQVVFFTPGGAWHTTVTDLFGIMNTLLKIGADLEVFIGTQERQFRLLSDALARFNVLVEDVGADQ
jgi:hypothetical protein